MPRRSKTPPLVSVPDYEQAAAKSLPLPAREYLNSGAADELSLRRNRAAFDDLLLKPRVLRDVSRLDISVELFGRTLEHPVFLAPTAYHKLFHRQGELATARAAAKAGALLCVSSFSTTSLEDIARATTATKWFQLYMPPVREIPKDLVRRAAAAGYDAICMTIDTPVLGVRNREMRTGFGLPRGMHRENLRPYGISLTDSAHYSKSGAQLVGLDASITWKEVDWVRSLTKLPVVLKGILAPEDAKLAVEHGAAGIIVSNHGARNLDTTPATIEALPQVVEAVAGRIPVFLDGGIRRGTDILKALALGARAVFVGRPYLWGLAVEGEAGVHAVIRILVEELRAVMALCGRPSIASLDRSVFWPR